VRWNLLEGEPVKINMHEFEENFVGLSHDDPAVRLKSVSGLAKYSSAEWQGTPDAITDAVSALVSASRLQAAVARDGAFRAEAAKVLGNIGTQSPAVLPELVRLLQRDADGRVRTEAARALGKIGEGAASASRSIAAVLDDLHGGESVRGAAAWALARVDPCSAGTAFSLQAAADDRSGYVSVIAAEALWKVSPQTRRAILALAARLGDPAVRQAAAQALYRIGPAAKEAVPALMAAAKDKDRLFRESVLLALRKIDPQATAKARLS
jgi:HEAT repeat protein